MKHIIIILLLTTTTTATFSANANPVPDFPFIILTEELEKQIKPDIAMIGFYLIAYAPTSSESLEQLRMAGKHVIELLNKNQITLSQLESNQIEKEAKRERKNDVYSLEILGYETSQSFNLKLSHLEIYPTLMNELISIDGLSGIDVKFESTKESKYKADMIKELSQKARDKADVLAQAQSKTVKSVYGITTQSNFGEAYAIFKLKYAPDIQPNFRLSSSLASDLTMMVPEYISIFQQITVIYELK